MSAQRVRRLSCSILAAALLALIAACGSSSSSSSDNGGDSSPSFVSWTGSVNDTLVLDANGNDFKFDASDGCMFGANTAVGPAGFCLTVIGSGYAASGATNCSDPANNSLCDTGTFKVLLTDNPAGGGCIAVLSAGAAGSVTAQVLAVSNTGSGFDIQTGTSAGAFTVHWNGFVPICGGSNQYAGSYQYASTGVLGPGIGCTQQFNNVGAANNLTSIDSGGVINNDSAEFSGLIAAAGTGSFTAQGTSGGTLTFTINSVSQAGGKWTIAGTGGDCTGSWSLTQQ